jgi:hypothetical protein
MEEVLETRLIRELRAISNILTEIQENSPYSRRHHAHSVTKSQFQQMSVQNRQIKKLLERIDDVKPTPTILDL